MKNTSRRSDYAGIDKICAHCHQQYNDVPNRRIRFCSLDCSIKHKQIQCVCKSCGKKYMTGKTRNTTYCSRECMFNDYRGKTKPAWVGEKITLAKLKGRQPANIRQIRKLKKYQDTRAVVLARDNHICQICGESGDNLHHIYEAYMHKNKIFNPNNGITLCKWCHDKRVSKHESDWVSYFEFNLTTRFCGSGLSLT